MKTAHHYMLALSEAERTENVKAMVDIILLDAENAIDESYQAGLEEGMELGAPE